MIRRYQAVFLDAAGTVVRPHPSINAIYAEACRRCGSDVGDEAVAAALRDLWAEYRASPEAQRASYDTSEEATREWWARFNTGVFQRLGMREGLERFLAVLWEVFGRAESWRLYPEVEETIVGLRHRGYQLGIVSNWDSRLLVICDGLGLTERVDFILASAAVGMEKPDRRIFEIALARAGVPAERALHVGDDYEADVLGARGAGIDAILVDRDGRCAGDGTTAIRSLRELLGILP